MGADLRPVRRARAPGRAAACSTMSPLTDTARDLDLLRQAVGSPRLNYLGVSDGTGLGAVYANLFPATTGHLVLDGNFDPVAWSGGGAADVAAGQDGLAAEAADLPGPVRSGAHLGVRVLGRDSGRHRAKFARLLQILRRHPVNVGSPPQAFTYADLFVNFPLGDVDRWQLRSADLQKLWTDATSSSGQPSGQASFGLPAAASAGVYTGLDQNYAVSCTDEADPRNVSDYAPAARLAQARAGGYGLYFTWTEEPCADWPATAPSDRYTGPWNRRTASTILVMSLTGDPATPYQDAIAMTRDLARARLLTVAGWAHRARQSQQLRHPVRGEVPDDGRPAAGRVVCAQNTAPFPGRPPCRPPGKGRRHLAHAGRGDAGRSACVAPARLR